MLAWIVAGLAWIMVATSLPALQPHIAQWIAQFVTGVALLGFLLTCLQWWHVSFAAGTWNDNAFALQVMGLAADHHLRSASRRPEGDATI